MEMPDVGNIEKEESGITIDECSDTISDKDVLVVNSSEQSRLARSRLLIIIYSNSSLHKTQERSKHSFFFCHSPKTGFNNVLK